MKKIFLVLAISLASCTTIPVSAPAPLAATSIDEKTLIVGLQTFDALLTSVDELIAAKVIVPGSPTALKLANDIDSAKLAFQAAQAAQAAGNATSYSVALSQTQTAVADISTLIKGN